MYRQFVLDVWKSIKRKQFFTINFIEQCEVIIDFTEKAKKQKKENNKKNNTTGHKLSGRK